VRVSAGSIAQLCAISQKSLDAGGGLRKLGNKVKWTYTFNTDCDKTVSTPPNFGALRLQLSERQIPQVVGFIRSG
jgi:hypothetical protein